MPTKDDENKNLGTIPLRRHMTIAMLAPVALLIVMGLVLGRQISKLVDSGESVSHTNQVISKLYETRNRIVDTESALRGYLLSGDRTSLDRFESASPQVPLDDSKRLIADNPVQQERLRDVEASMGEWMGEARAAIAADVKVAREDNDALRRRRARLERVRLLLDEAIAAEESLLRERTVENADTEQTSRYMFIGLLALAAFIIAFVSRRELGAVSIAFQGLVQGEREAREKSANQEWIRRGEANVSGAVVGERDVSQVATSALATLVEHTGAVVGAVYQVRGKLLNRAAGYAIPDGESSLEGGQLAQVVTDAKLRRVTDAKAQLAAGGGTAKATTVELVMAPLAVNEQVIGVIELGFQVPPGSRTTELLQSLSTPVALAIRGAEQRARLKELLEETQRQGEELQTQHEELRVTNEELEHQSTALREANARQAQIQHELEATNANLEEQTALLEQQREELQTSQKELQERARELQQASQYKSEFLARMSHELRTPLNSSLILARLLGDNPSGNLSVEQVKFANTIYSAGNDLLLLINDILDLAKIEAGRLELRVGPVHLARVRDTLGREFEPVAQSKGLTLKVEVASDVPAQLLSDEQRLVQVLRNLVSNACKFTDTGDVTVSVVSEGSRVRFDVRDTGIGIPPEHVDRVFDAFHQVDGGVARKHGGTGLGLAISRDLAALLGGTLTLKSIVGQGTVFSLTIPVNAPTVAPPPPPSNLRNPGMQRVVQPPVPAVRQRKATGRQTIVSAGAASDDRDKLDPQKRTLLVIEDDAAFAQILVDLGRELGFQALAAPTADEGIALALEHHPDGILLDVNLPDHSGLTVLERIKRQPLIRHVPVHMISGTDHAQRALELGAIGYLMKPASRENLVQAIKRIEERTSRTVRRLLIVEDDAVQADALTHLLGGADIEITSTDKVSEALVHLSKTTFDCVVMDLRLTDGTGFELLEKMTADERITFPPVIVHTGKDLSDAEEAKLRHHSSSIIVKGARSPERLLDEVALFLHQVEAEMPPDRQRILREVRSRESIFEGKRVLVVEDDVRNVFALTSILEPRGLSVTIARNGREALEMLDKGAVDLVLMDIMMPEMDGLEATRRIRTRKDGAERLPIIALTAKAMADDRQACLDAGANDYLAKPIDIDMLLSLLRVWMPR